MSKHRFLLVVCVFFSLLARVSQASAEEIRTWHSADGRFSAQAELLGMVDDVVRMRRSDGKVITVPLNKLSEEDRQYVRRAIARDSPASPKTQVQTERYHNREYGFSFTPPVGLKCATSDDEEVIALFKGASGTNIVVGCMERSADYDLDQVWSGIRAAMPSQGVAEYKELGTGKFTVDGTNARWLLIAHRSANAGHLKAIQYVFASRKWVFFVTCTANADQFSKHRAEFDAAVSGIRFE